RLAFLLLSKLTFMKSIKPAVFRLLTWGLLQISTAQESARPCPIQWLRGYGGSQTDELADFVQKRDGGIIFLALSGSPADGTKRCANDHDGDANFWLVNCDANGNQLWDYCFGGSSIDWPSRLRETPDGG